MYLTCTISIPGAATVVIRDTIIKRPAIFADPITSVRIANYRKAVAPDYIIVILCNYGAVGFKINLRLAIIVSTEFIPSEFI